MAQMAGAARRPPRHVLGAYAAPAPVLLSAQSPDRALRVRSKTVTQGTVCGKSARTGLWGCRRATADTTRRERRLSGYQVIRFSRKGHRTHLSDRAYHNLLTAVERNLS